MKTISLFRTSALIVAAVLLAAAGCSSPATGKGKAMGAWEPGDPPSAAYALDVGVGIDGDGASLAAVLTGSGSFPGRAGVFAESHLPLVDFGWSGLRAFVGPSHKLIEAGSAYACFCDSETLRKNREAGQECEHRSKPSEEQMRIWKGMLKGEMADAPRVVKAVRA